MAVLWSELIDPATLTGYVRTSVAEYELQKGTLASFLPNVDVDDIVIRMAVGSTGLTEIARFRAYDAEPEFGSTQPLKRVTVDLPALGQQLPVDEYTQLRNRKAKDEVIVNSVEKVAEQVGRAVVDAMEYMRGIVINTGKATTTQNNFYLDNDFGRDAALTFTAPALWSVAATDAMGQMQAWSDLYAGKNAGAMPGCVAMSTRVFRALGSLNQFRTQLASGTTNPASKDESIARWSGYGFPDIFIYDRQVQINGALTKVLPDDRIYLLPAPGPVRATQGSELGATFWGKTLTSEHPDFGIYGSDQPGIVVGTWRNPKPPMGIEVISDAIGMPVLANANLSASIKVL